MAACTGRQVEHQAAGPDQRQKAADPSTEADVEAALALSTEDVAKRSPQCMKADEEIGGMILYTLHCAARHEFEAWFRDGEAFEAQRKAGEIACPQCGDSGVQKALMAPRIGRSRERQLPSPAQLRAVLAELRQQVESNCDYVGERFAEEARRIHYGETDPHGIYGEASREESAALAEEGIQFGWIPWVGPTDA